MTAQVEINPSPTMRALAFNTHGKMPECDNILIMFDTENNQPPMLAPTVSLIKTSNERWFIGKPEITAAGKYSARMFGRVVLKDSSITRAYQICCMIIRSILLVSVSVTSL